MIMRYLPGSIKLGMKDGGLLEIVGTATRITHDQLFQLAKLKSIEKTRRVYEWRVERLVTHDLLRQSKILYRGSDPVYSITRNGIYGLQGLSIHLVSVYVDLKDGKVEHQVQHAVELNNIHIALQRSGKLSRWTPAKFLQALNLAPPFNYAKYYDAIATVYLNSRRLDIAIEYEHTLKRPLDRYAALKAKLSKEQRADAILFLVPTPEIQNTLWGQLMDLRRNVMIIRLQHLMTQGLDAAVDLNYQTLTLGEALKRISEQRTT
jgi:hypothetical protein